LLLPSSAKPFRICRHIGLKFLSSTRCISSMRDLHFRQLLKFCGTSFLTI
jgi:hypothetical protein